MTSPRTPSGGTAEGLTRRKGLQRKTPMKRGEGPKRTGGPARSSKPLPRQSAKRKAEAPRRAEVRRTVVERDGLRCAYAAIVPEVRCWSPDRDEEGRPWLDLDEIAARGSHPGSHLDPEVCRLTCRAHHDWKTDNPAEAERRGIRRRYSSSGVDETSSTPYDPPDNPSAPTPRRTP